MIKVLADTMIFLGIMVALAYVTTIGALTIIKKSMKEEEEMEKDYVYMNDGTAVEFNEDDQE